MKVLLGDITSYKAISVANFLKKKYPYIKLYTYDSHNFTKHIKSKYSDKHFVIDTDNLESYLKIINDYQVDYFFPVINKDIAFILENKVKFRGCLDYFGEYSIFKLLNDKKQLMTLADRLNILIPKTYKNINEAKIPCVIKPTNLSSAKGVIYVKTEIQLKNAINKFKLHKSFMAQDLIEGVGVGYSVYAKDGEIITGYGHKRLAEYPVTGGSSVYREAYNDDRMQAIARKILKEWSWTGFAMFEFKLTPQNELYLIEVNPRIWGSINQGLQNGVNYFKNIFGEITQHKSTEIKTYLSPFFYYALLRYLFRLDFNHIIDFIRNWKYNKPDVNIWDDPKGYLSIILRKLL